MARPNQFANTDPSNIGQSYQPFNPVPQNVLARGLSPYGFTVAGLRKQKPTDEKIRQMAIAAVIAKYRKAHAGM